MKRPFRRKHKGSPLGLAAFIKILTLAGLVALMLAMGLKVTFGEVLGSIRQTQVIALSFLANYVLVPVVAFGLLRLYHTAPLTSAGLLIAAVCPAAPLAPPFVALAKGDVPSSLGQMVVLTCLSPILSPLLLTGLLAQVSPGVNLHVNSVAIVQTLLVAQLLPLAVGLAIHHWVPALSARICKPVRWAATAMLLGIVVLLLTQQHSTLAAVHPRGWIGMLILFVASLGIGWVCGGSSLATRKAVGLTTAVRNAAVGLVIVSRDFAGTSAVSALVAYSMVSILGTLGFAAWLGRRGLSNSVE